MSTDFINYCSNILNNQLTQLKYKFRPNKYVTYVGAETYEERFKSLLLYEWSKRKAKGEPFNMWVSCLVVENHYIHRYDDVFLFDEHENNISKKVKGLIKILNRFFFPDVEVFFFVEEGDDKRTERMHLIEDVAKMKQENFLIGYNFSSMIEN